MKFLPVFLFSSLLAFSQPTPVPAAGPRVQSPPQVIIADNPLGADGTPTEQLLIVNPNTTSSYGQTMLGFGVWNGSAIVKCGWVGTTANSFSFAPRPQATYLENGCAGGVLILADDPTYGRISFYSGGYTSDAFKRMEITPQGQIVALGTDGSTQGLAVQATAQNGTAAKSYMPIDFYDGANLNSQIVSYNGNYSNPGVNVTPNSLGFANYATNGYVFFAAAGSNGAIVFNTGGQGSANTRAVIAPDGGFQIASASLPACNSAHRGTIFYQAGGGGVADVREMCMKAADDSYSWVVF